MAPPPPPLLSTRPTWLQGVFVILVPLVFGTALGLTLSESELGWLIGNVLAVLGGVAGGFEHETARSGAKRGALGGVMFGTGIVIGDAITAAGPIVGTLDPIAIFPLLAATGGVLLGAFGGRLRARHEARAPQ